MKQKLKTLLSLTAVCHLLTANCFALDLGFAKEDGGRPGAFLSFGAGARSLALGKTFVGVADDASSIYWNPAGLATLQKPEIMAFYANMYEQTGYSFAAGAYPLKTVGSQQSAVGGKGKDLGTIGIALVNLSSRGFQLRDELNYEVGEGGVSETAAILSYGTKLRLADSRWQMAVGANVKIVNQNIDTQSDTGYGIDLGFLWKPDGSSLPANVGGQAQTADGRLRQILKPLSIGLSIQNLIAPKLTLIEDTDKYPLAATLGISYRFFNRKLLTAVDLNKTENRQVKLHIGAEYIFIKMLAFRVGLDETEVTSGLGFTWQNYSLDYAFAYHDAWPGYEDLGLSHRFGLTMRWGKVKQLVVNSSELVAKTNDQLTTAPEAAAPVVLVAAPETALSEEKLKQEIKEQIEKPQTTSAKQLTYTVKPGDCLWDIAGQPEIYDNSWNWILIYEANQDQIKNPALIYPGQVLMIPLKH